ncbi:MAG: HD domain-containing protein [Puniceicoccales bacterium]|jgi:3'-5' exoribonuclease|nr:HD domain-containing protein [Puniceicoccales bacterium]
MTNRSSLSTAQSAKTLAQGVAFSGLYLLRKCGSKSARNGSPFLSVELGDKTGGITTTIFSDSPVFKAFSEAEAGAVLLVDAIADFYQERFSPRITGVEPVAIAQLSQGQVDLLVESSPEENDSMWAEFGECIEAIGHEALRATVRSVFDEIGETFRHSSAAVSMHHAYRGGLLEHTLHMARAARVLLPLYPQVNPSLALAGILLHDIGKILEYTQGMVTKVTRAGRLHGHVVLGYQFARKHGLRNKLAPHLLERLEHVILSHQGQRDWGAAALAATPEAVFVSMVDNLDAKMGMVQRALRNAAPGDEFSEYLPGLESAVLLTKVED